jgi:formate hydrogenlyase subunit 6/NADH:ubiquinone oxidoreductase subunit I
MLITLKNRFEQGCRTSAYPKTTIELPARYRGQPQVHAEASSELAVECAAACPQETINAERRLIDMGRCVFCGTCERLSEGRFIFSIWPASVSTLWHLHAMPMESS